MYWGGETDTATSGWRITDDSRGGTEVVGVVLLIGFVLVAATSVVVVGSSALTTVQEQSEGEQIHTEVRSISSSVNDAVYSESSRTVSGIGSGYTVSDGPSVSIRQGNTEIYNHSIGRIERDGVVYEGGMVIDGREVTSAPNIALQNESTTLRFPRLDHDDASQFDGEIRHNETRTVPVDSTQGIEIVIESEYYEQWYDHLSNSNAVTNVTKDDTAETVHIRYSVDKPDDVRISLNLGMSDGSDFDLNSIPETHIESYEGTAFDRHNAVVGTTADAGNMGAGSGQLTIQGTLRSEGDISDFDGHQQTDISRGVESFVDVSDPTPTDELIIDRDTAENAYSAQEYDAGDGDLEGGVYYTDGDLTLSDVTVEDQTILVVDGDLTVDGTVEVKEALDVHVHGSVTLDGAGIETTTPHQADRVSLFATDTIDVASDSTVTGMIHATDSTLEVDRESAEVYGAVSIDDITGHQNHGTFDFYYDEDLQGKSPYATSRIPGLRADPFADYSGNTTTGDADFTYETIPDDLLVTGDIDAEGTTVNGDLLSEGEISFLRTDVENLAAKDDIDIEEGTIGGNVWLGNGSDLTHTRAEINGDVFVDGEADLQGGTIHGDVYVNEEVDVSNAHIEGDLIAGDDITLTDGTVDGDVRTNGDLDTERSSIGGEIHVTQELDFDDGSTGGDIFVGDDVEFDSADADGGNGDIHAGGDIDCSGASLDTIYVGTGSTVTCTGGTVSSDAPTPPTVPSDLPPDLGIPDVTTLTGVDHYFDIRIAEMNVE